MKVSFRELHIGELLASVKTLDRNAYIAIAVLLALLIAAIVFAVTGWSASAGTDVPVNGYVALAVGVIGSLGLGFGLMALVFYSSRAGYDEPARLYIPEDEHPEE